MDSLSEQESAFLGAARSADNWGALAERLRRAADVVLREKQTAPPYEEAYRPSPSFWLGAVHMMLLGYAVEVAAKGLLVGQDPARWVDESKPTAPFRWTGKGHNLGDLLRDTKMALSPDEEGVALLLQDFVEWGGRYPSPRKLANGRPLTCTGSEIALAEALYDRLDAARRLLSAGCNGEGSPAS